MLQKLGQSDVQASVIALGCMRMWALSVGEAGQVLDAALEHGINFFDHADVYGGGESELRFGQAVRNLGVERENLLLQSKCGIRPGYFDFSKEHILASAEESLERLGTDYLDFLLLHRPDVLMEPEEVAEAFSQLKKQGKVKYFGVSNHSRYQIELLQTYLDEPLVINQMQLSPAHTVMFDAAFNVNMANQAGVDRDNGTMEYCRLNRITIQAWSPFQIDSNQGLFMTNERYKELAQKIESYAEHYRVSAEAIIVAWLLRHPAHVQVLIGSMNPARIARIMKAQTISLTRFEWYDIYQSAGNRLPSRLMRR
ncbi:aldo/keto reductase family oxidoreductase [Streptococcus chenjunshii]|uniref:Aldo/keto reductase family oxidoreductase n=1 Tax=Streptococcus chenjunshii TaxID=2173853 RepID=A0A372KM06_9STRE|nr:aldo/keto reductase [Streptococcus chenjunshii]AXQ78054.1 aldo/keto reductase family oxidoreductase [Streptococcus chenjunshii]RFU51149.1 aldo/keto reductase family oxidoreductase [Streptococcus chenjunshii]RFU53311.1 aldo/keto reductase family oxidoreductase [Streptococcus chenjunshii]